jgi:outer membrane receptor for ferrienterochelin and colicin
MSKFFVILIFIFSKIIAFSQNNTLFGYVSDQNTGEKLIGAGVYAPTLKKGVTTNTQGYFSLTLPQGRQQISFSYLGYQSLNIEIEVSKDTLLSIVLVSGANLKEVEIVSSINVNNDRPNTILMPIKEIKNLPAIGGEVDIIKAIQRLPGIKSGNEGTTGLFVRGGTPDQNLILLDGVPIYNISHLFGFVSVFNATSINHLEVIKGGFPARYGGRLASVIDIHTKDGNLKSWHGEIEAGIISSKIFVEGPLKKDISSISISARRSFYEVYTLPKKWIGGDGEFNNLNFYDFNIKANYKLSARDKVSFSSYFGKDALNLKRKDSEDTLTGVNNRILRWGNTINSVRWNHLWGEQLFSNVSLYSNLYSYILTSDRQTINNKNDVLLNQRFFKFSSKINDIGAIVDFNYYPSPRHSIKFGGTLVSHVFKPGFNSTKIGGQNQPIPIDTSNKVAQITAIETRVYAEDNFKINSKLNANLGAHTSMFDVRNKKYYSIEPRLFLTFSGNKKWGLSAGFTSMQQYLHLLTNSGIGIPADLWVPPTDKVAPQKSWQASIGWNSKILIGWEISIDAYYKEMKNLIDYKPGSSFLIEGADWENKVALNGSGTSKGIEFFARKTKGRLTGMAGYTLSWADRSFKDIDNGKVFPFRYDRRHDFQISSSYLVNKKITFNAAWTFNTGNPVTLPVSIYPSTLYPPIPNSFVGSSGYDIIDFDPSISNSSPFQEGTIVLYYGTKNNQRMPSYHRLDVSVQFTKKKKHGERSWAFQVYNIYNQINPYYIRYSYSGGSLLNPLDAKGEFQIVSLFQIIPSLSYAYKF